MAIIGTNIITRLQVADEPGADILDCSLELPLHDGLSGVRHQKAGHLLEAALQISPAHLFSYRDGTGVYILENTTPPGGGGQHISQCHSGGRL